MLQVVTYNLYWWCVSDEYGNCPQFAQGKGFAQLYSRLRQNGPFDLIGFQECDNPGPVIWGIAWCFGSRVRACLRAFMLSGGWTSGCLQWALKVFTQDTLYPWVFCMEEKWQDKSLQGRAWLQHSVITRRQQAWVLLWITVAQRTKD